MIPTTWITSPSVVRTPRDISRSLNLNPTAERATVIIRIVPEYIVRLFTYNGDVALGPAEDISIYVPNVLRVILTGINGLAAFIRNKLNCSTITRHWIPNKTNKTIDRNANSEITLLENIMLALY